MAAPPINFLTAAARLVTRSLRLTALPGLGARSSGAADTLAKGAKVDARVAGAEGRGVGVVMLLAGLVDFLVCGLGM